MSTQTPDLPAQHPSGAPAHDPLTQTLALLQPWIEYVPKRQRRLGIFIFLAFLVHLAAFYFIRIDATRAELRHPAHVHISIENQMPGSSEEITPGDDFWDRLTDPRLFLMPQNPLGSLSSDGPSLDFAALNPNLEAPQFPDPVQVQAYPFMHQAAAPSEQSVAATMVPQRQPFSYDPTPPVIAPGTTLQWDATLSQRQPTGAPDLPSPVSDTDLTPTELRVAVNPDGTVEHALVEQSCGSGRLDLDQLAVLAVRKTRFHSTDQPGLLWGRVTIFWHYAPQPREEVVPTPPSST